MARNIRARIILDIETNVSDDDNVSNIETLRFMVDEDLKDLGYIVYNSEVKNG